MIATILCVLAALIAVNALAMLLKGAKYLVAGNRVKEPTSLQRFMAEIEQKRVH